MFKSLPKILSVILVAVALAMAAQPAFAGGPVLVCIDACDGGPVVGGGDGGITVNHGTSERVPGRGAPRPGPGGGHVSYSYVEEYATPTCSGNVLNGRDVLCGAAVNSCPAPVQVRFWIWHRAHLVTYGPAPVYVETDTVQGWRQEAGSFCLGPDDPTAPVIARVVAGVQELWASQRLPLPRWAVRTDPGPRTLVHFPTSFSAGSAVAQRIDTTILGSAVHITAVPLRWTWVFGDGQRLVTSSPGRPKSDDVTHEYGELGAASTHVVVQWGGTFRVGTSPEVYDIRGPATVTGPTSVVRVLQSRAQLIAG